MIGTEAAMASLPFWAALWAELMVEPLADSFHNDLQQGHHRCFRSTENGDN